MKENVDVCIVGGGVVGLFTALELANAGMSVRIVDKLYNGSSRYNIGDVLLQGYDEKLREFSKFTHKAWGYAAESFGRDMGFERRGSAFLAMSDEDAERLKADVAEDNKSGIDTKWIEGRDLVTEALDGNQVGENVVGAKIFAEDGIIDTQKSLDALRGQLVQKGVRIWGSDLVTDFVMEGDRVTGIKTAAGDECSAKYVVVAAGVWSNFILGKAGLYVPMRPARCHLIEVSPTGRVPTQLISHCEPNGEFIFKYQRSGRVLCSYSGRHDQAQATWRNSVDQEAVNWMTEKMPEFLYGMRFPKIQDVHTVTLAITPDEMPVVGKVSGLEGLIVAIGCNGHSYAFAAGIAKLVQDMVEEKDPEVDISKLSPDRYPDTCSNLGKTDPEVTMELGDKPADDPAVTMTVGDLPADDPEATMELGDKPEDDPDVTMEVGDKPAADSEAELIVDGDKPSSTEDEAELIVEENGNPLTDKEKDPEFIAEGDARRDEEDSGGTLVMDENGSALDKEDKEPSLITDGDSALGEEDKEKAELLVEGGSALGEDKDSEAAGTLIVDDEDGSALGKDQNGDTKGTIVMDDDESALRKQKEDETAGTLVMDEDGSALDKEEAETAEMIVEGGSALTGKEEKESTTTMVVDDEEGSALTKQKDDATTGTLVVEEGTSDSSKNEEEKNKIVVDDERSYEERKKDREAQQTSTLVIEEDSKKGLRTDKPSTTPGPEEKSAEKGSVEELEAEWNKKLEALDAEKGKEADKKKSSAKSSKDKIAEAKAMAAEKAKAAANNAGGGGIDARTKILAAREAAKNKADEDERKKKEAARAQILKAKEAAKDN